ncbi:unnamed protein product [Trichobilharzia regenti]|nr:unnamed protein product [Trichobilharzia regenti]
MELSLCSVNDVFDSSAVAVAACAAAALTAGSSAAYPTSSLKTMRTPTAGGFDTTNLVINIDFAFHGTYVYCVVFRSFPNPDWIDIVLEKNLWGSIFVSIDC